MSEQNTQRICPACARAFECMGKAGLPGCWCAQLPPLARAPEPDKGCYCPECLKKMLDEESLTA